MYGQNPLQDARRAGRAILTNQLARLAPGLYVRLTHQTGRGGGEESVETVAAYFRRCFDDYFRMLGISPGEIDAYLQGKVVLEYGPGDVPGVALLMVAHGAERVVCVDRFPMVTLSDKNRRILEALAAQLEEPARRRALDCLSGDRLDPARIAYRVRPSGLSGLVGEVDLILSRAVLEHVDDLEATFADMEQALKPAGVAIHQVDLKSHGLHRQNPLDFLTWPPRLWDWMYAGKGVPNRWRVDRYRRILAACGLITERLEPTALAEARDVEQVRPFLAAPFREVSPQDLAWLGFWLVCRKPRV